MILEKIWRRIDSFGKFWKGEVKLKNLDSEIMDCTLERGFMHSSAHALGLISAQLHKPPLERT